MGTHPIAWRAAAEIIRVEECVATACNITIHRLKTPRPRMLEEAREELEDRLGPAHGVRLGWARMGWVWMSQVRMRALGCRLPRRSPEVADKVVGRLLLRRHQLDHAALL